MATSLGLKISFLFGVWGYCHAAEKRNLASPDAAIRANAVAYAKKCVDLAATFYDPPLL